MSETIHSPDTGLDRCPHYETNKTAMRTNAIPKGCTVHVQVKR